MVVAAGCPALWSRAQTRRCPSCGCSPADCAHTITAGLRPPFKAVWSLVCVRQDGRLLQWPQVGHRVTGLRCATAGLRMRSMRSCNAQFPNQMLLLVSYMPLASFSVQKRLPKCCQAPSRAAAKMQQLWHLWPHTKQHLYLCIAAVLALYLHTSDDATALRCGTIVAVSVLPASAHAPAAVVASMLLPPRQARCLLPQILLSRRACGDGRTPARGFNLTARRWRASLGGSAGRRLRGGSRAPCAEPLANAVVFGPSPARCGHAAGEKRGPRLSLSRGPILRRAPRVGALRRPSWRWGPESSLASLALFPRRPVREPGAADARGRRVGRTRFRYSRWPRVRVARKPMYAYALHGKRWRFPNAVLPATACLETVAFVRAAFASRLLFRAGSAPLVQGACFALRVCATGGTATKRSGSAERGPSRAAFTHRTPAREVDVDPTRRRKWIKRGQVSDRG